MEEDIEQRLLDKGVSPEELTNFEDMPLHNAKQDVFRRIAMSTDIQDLKTKSHDKFLFHLAEVLKMEGVDKYDIKDKKAAQLMATRMLDTLNNGDYGQYEKLSLGRLYKDTLSRGQ